MTFVGFDISKSFPFFAFPSLLKIFAASCWKNRLSCRKSLLIAFAEKRQANQNIDDSYYL